MITVPFGNEELSSTEELGNILACPLDWPIVEMVLL